MYDFFKFILTTFYDKVKENSLKRKINQLYKSVSIVNIPINIKKKHLELYKKFNVNCSTRWLEVYSSISEIVDYRYISEINYYIHVEPILNNRSFSEAYCDKNFYHKYLDNALLPRVYIRNIEGVYYDEKYEYIKNCEEIFTHIPKDIEKIIVKRAVDSGGGKDVYLYKRDGNEWRELEHNKKLYLNSLDSIFKKNFLIQEYINQHPFYAQFNSSSVNTVRVLTYRSVKTNEIIPLQAVLRIGKRGSIVDNQASGGIACGIRQDGSLNNFAVNKKGEKFTNFQGINFNQIGKIYKYQEIIKIALKIAKYFPYHRLLGFDFCVDSLDKIRLIEINNRNNEINFFQMSNGPLFREYTEEVISYCIDKKRTFCFDYEF